MQTEEQEERRSQQEVEEEEEEKEEEEDGVKKELTSRVGRYLCCCKSPHVILCHTEEDVLRFDVGVNDVTLGMEVSQPQENLEERDCHRYI